MAKTINLLMLAIAFVQVQAVHFYAQKDQWRCFKDMVASNYVSTSQST
jgi:hypothetical protein